MRCLILALLALTVAAPAQPAPQTIHVVRHFDTPVGEKDPDLLPEGAARAQALARWFRGKRLCAILVSDYKRTRQTVAPLAAGRSIAVQTYDPRDTPAVVTRAKASACPVLIVGHSNTVPDIVQQLGGTRPAALEHPDFGDIWTIEGGRTAHATIAP